MPGKSDVSVADLVTAGLLHAGSVLHHESGSTATVMADGSLDLSGQRYPSPTAAHLSLSRVSRNGWLVWRLGPAREDATLDSLRHRFRSGAQPA